MRIDERMTFDQLFRISDPKRVARSFKVRGPPLEIDAYKDAEYYSFNFKSYPSTTGLRHRGYIKFFRPKNPHSTPLQHLECMVDCECPDTRYRWAWANKQRGSGAVGIKSLNQALNRAPRITNPTGKPGLCIAEGELVATFKGCVPIENVSVGDQVWTLNGWHSVTDAALTGHKEVVTVTLVSGRKLELTREHELLIFEDKAGFSWIKAGDLKETHKACISIPNKLFSKIEEHTLAPKAHEELTTLISDVLVFDSVKNVSGNRLTNVYDLTVEGAEHFTVNGIIVHNCKHILAARAYIYGLLSQFDSEEPDTAYKLDKLLKHATKRWLNYSELTQQAREREAKYRQRVSALNIYGPKASLKTELGLKDIKPTEKIKKPEIKKVEPEKPEIKKVEPEKPEIKKIKPEKIETGKEPKIKKPEFKIPEVPPLPPEYTAKKLIKREPPRVPTPLPKDISAKKSITGKPKNKSSTGQIGPYSWYRPEHKIKIKTNLITETVVNLNIEPMITLREAQKLVQEMADDAFGSTQAVEPIEPSEPPISDTAIGADTEGETALGLLRQMKDLLQQLVAGLAPESGELAGEEGMPSEEGMPAPEGEGADEDVSATEMPDEPPNAEENEEFEEEKEEEEEGEEKPKGFSNRRPE